MNYENLTKEQLIKLLENKDKKNEKLEAKIDNLETKNNKLEHKIDKLEIELKNTRLELEKLIMKYDIQNQRVLKDTYERFVTKSEHVKPSDEVINEAEEKCEKQKVGRKQGGTNFTSSLVPTRTIIKDLDSKECPKCREAFIEIGEDRTIKIVKVPAKYEAIEIITKKYKCSTKDCEETIYQKESDEVFGHSPVTPSVVADIINMKYNLGVPLDRYSKYLSTQGIELSTQSLSNYVIKASEILEPIYQKIREKLVNNKAKVIYVDETTLNVLELTERQNSYMFVYCTSFYDEPVYLYDFSESRRTQRTEDLLKDFNGTLICDKYSGYDKFKNKGIKLQRCLAHARRNFYDIVKPLSANEQKSSKAKKVVDLMGKLFEAESKMKKENKTVYEIVGIRQSDIYQKYISDLHDYIFSLNPQPKSLLEKAVHYMKESWDEFFTYLSNGYVECTNNIAERAVKPFVIARKNFLFSKTENGANASALLFTILQTAKANGLIPDLYLEYLLTNINTKNIDSILPWSNDLSNELRIKIRKQ